MRSFSRLLLVALAAACATSLGAVTASASTGFEFRALSGELGSFTARAAALTFTDSEGVSRVICEVTRTLTVHRSIAKSVGALIGSATNVVVTNCRGGNVRVATETLPWHVQYVSFSGTLPLIQSIRMRLAGATFLLEAFFGAARCSYRGTPEGVSSVSAEHLISSIVADEGIQIPLERPLGLDRCPEEGVFRGTLETSPIVEVRLI